MTGKAAALGDGAGALTTPPAAARPPVTVPAILIDQTTENANEPC